MSKDGQSGLKGPQAVGGVLLTEEGEYGVEVKTIGGQEGVLVAGIGQSGGFRFRRSPRRKGGEALNVWQLNSLSESVQELDRQLRELKAEIAKKEYYEVMGVAQDYGVSVSVPYRVYLGDESGLPRFEMRMLRANDLFDVDVLLDGVQSSWWQTGWVRFRDEYLPLAEDFVKSVFVDRAHSSNDQKDAETIKMLADAIKGQSVAAVQLGHIVVLQYVDRDGQSVFWAKKMTSEQALFVESNPVILKDPERLHEALLLVSQGVKVMP